MNFECSITQEFSSSIAMNTLGLFSLLVFLGFQSLTGRTVIIDPGHGGRDRGGSWGKVYEKHLALDTAFRLERILKEKGYRVVMSRRSDQFVSLSQRVAMARRYRGAIFVSIHYNQSWNTKAGGLETFYFDSRSKRLAQEVQKGMVGQAHVTNRGAKWARYYVLRNNRLRAVLVECGFVSHRRDRNRMKKGWYREAMARGIADGIGRGW